MILRSLLTGFSLIRQSYCFTFVLENYCIAERIKWVIFGLRTMFGLVQQTYWSFFYQLISLGWSKNMSLRKFNLAFELVFTNCRICLITFRASISHSRTQNYGFLCTLVDLGLFHIEAVLFTRLRIQWLIRERILRTNLLFHRLLMHGESIWNELPDPCFWNYKYTRC